MNTALSCLQNTMFKHPRGYFKNKYSSLLLVEYNVQTIMIFITLTQNENFTLYFLNSCFVSIHVVVRFTHAYRYFATDKEYAICIQIQGIFKRQRLKTCSLRCTCWGTVGSRTALKSTRKHLQLITDNQNLIYCNITLTFSDGASFKRSKNPSFCFGMLNAGSMVNDILHHFGCSDKLLILLWTSTTVLGL